MKPTRRVLVAIGVLVLAMGAGLLVSWHLETRALRAALVSDIEAELARTIARHPKPDAPKHENGYACFVKVIEAMPADLSPFDHKSGATLAELLDAGVLTDAWQEKVERLEPWAESARGCGDSAGLEYVEGVTPFTSFRDRRSEGGNDAILALSRLARLRVRVATETAEAIAERCAATLEVAIDRSHVNLIGAMIAGAAVRQLTPSCGEALQQLSSETRPRFATRMEQLRARLVANHELLETERMIMSLELFGWTLSPAEREKVPEGDHMMAETLANPALRFAILRMWGRWDGAMRQLAANANATGLARQEASRGIDEVFNTWWMPAELSVGGPNYDRFFVRNEETAILLQLLADLATGGERPLPRRVTRETEGLVFTNFEGVRLIIPRR
ncbi:MAG: hypothetical protein Q8L48_24745 [Archangium sp.]|nr:hypothetical protein [Archangium sp.]